MLLYEVSAEYPNLVKNQYLRTVADLRALVITQSAANTVITSVVTKEVDLGHIAGFFKARKIWGCMREWPPQPRKGQEGGL